MPQEAPLAAKTVDELLKMMQVLSRTVDRVIESGIAAGEQDVPLSPSKLQIIRLLGNRRKGTSSQVARFLGVSSPAVTQIIDAMVADGYIRRTQAEHDRREVILELTEPGRKVFLDVRSRQRHLVRSAFRFSETSDAEQWLGVLRDVATTLAKADQVFHHFCLQCGAHADGTCVLGGGDADCIYLKHTQSVSTRSGRRSPRRRAKPA